MTNTQPPVTGNTPQPTITPEVGKRYVERSGWITPPLEACANTTHPFCIRMKNGTIFMSWMSDGMANGLDESEFDLIAEYVESSAPPDTFRRDLIARLYSAMLTKEYDIAQGLPYGCMAHEAIRAADTLIKAMESEAQS